MACDVGAVAQPPAAAAPAPCSIAARQQPSALAASHAHRPSEVPGLCVRERRNKRRPKQQARLSTGKHAQHGASQHGGRLGSAGAQGRQEERAYDVHGG